MGVDELGVDEMGVDEMGSRLSGNKPMLCVKYQKNRSHGFKRPLAQVS